ncbi:hypothetical protein ACFL6M_06255 [Candidatus Eisenbacteria bacterium]|uniref:Outer membrane protein beta-barrel domain-containing protein n=1 Tax=Eiseniibacteriota bacterium TaxID=2212470 RepID=A0ABV6YLH9_UNCEI
MPHVLRTLIAMLIFASGVHMSQCHAVECHGAIRVGYRGGTGAVGDLTFADLTPNIPLRLRIGLGYARLNPGNPEEAREIFINNATNGTPERSGRVWDYALDMLFPLRGSGPLQLWTATGPRHARFTGNFKYVGGNEDFDITCHQWGWGIGLESRTRMGSSAQLLLSAGVDKFFNAPLQGHDTSYSPDGESVNAREDFDYESADAAIHQPQVRLRLMAGVGFRLN